MQEEVQVPMHTDDQEACQESALHVNTGKGTQHHQWAVSDQVKHLRATSSHSDCNATLRC